MEKDKNELRTRLTAEQYRVTQEKGTEPPFSGEYWNAKLSGNYSCICCHTDLFSSETKFDSGTGWPSFWGPIKDDLIATETDFSYGMKRVEVKCSNCDSHLGHVFDDGPKATGLRYCLNSVSLGFKRPPDAG